MNKNVQSEEMYASISPGYYDRIFKKKKGMQSKWHCLKFDRIASMLGEYSAHLDVGCGPGSFISMLDPSKTSVGLDIDQGQIDYANQHYGKDQHSFVRQKAGDPFPFDDHSFDVITIIELVEHITLEEASQMMKEVFRVLRPGGRVIISTPNYHSLWPLLEFLVNRISEVSYEEQHITHFTKRRLKAFVEKSGLVIDRVFAYQFISFFLASLSWKLADAFNRFESKFLSRWFGFLIIAEARKRI